MATLEHPHYKRLIHSSVKSDGRIKTREIWQPDKEAHSANRRIITSIGMGKLATQEAGEDYPLFANVTGGIRGVGIADNVARHADNYYFYITDLTNAYGSLDQDRLLAQLRDLDQRMNPDECEELVREFCLHPSGKGIMQGAPASPLLFNIYCVALDAKLSSTAVDYGITYTRYFDDLTFSAPKEAGPIGKHKRRNIRQTILNDGWKIADRKTRVETLAKPITITGLSLYPTGYWQISPPLIEKIRQAFDEVEEKLDGSEPVSLHDQGVLDGYHGVITSGHDKRRGQLTPLEKRLVKRYKELRVRVTSQLGSSAVINF